MIPKSGYRFSEKIMLHQDALAMRGGGKDMPSFSVSYEQVKAGKARALSITSPAPYPLASEIPPTAATVPGFEMVPAFGWVGPASMPPDIAGKLTEELIAIGKLPEVRAALEKFGVQQTELPGPAYAAALTKERAGYARVIEQAGIKVP
jgi:tripartite-type tricarboxylate transporter receptor subunit TctC